MTQLLAVYGTLKRGLDNAHWLAGAEFVGVDVMTGITLYDFGPYPGALLEPSQGIEVEVYAVSPEQLQQLDLLEEYNAQAPDRGLYDRKLMNTRHGDAWVYLYNAPTGDTPALRRGSWQPVIRRDVRPL